VDVTVGTGTTVKGAVDDLDLVLKTLEKVGYNEDRFYIHVDGALFGLMMPIVKRVSLPCDFCYGTFVTVHCCNEALQCGGCK